MDGTLITSTIYFFSPILSTYPINHFHFSLARQLERKKISNGWKGKNISERRGVEEKGILICISHCNEDVMPFVS